MVKCYLTPPGSAGPCTAARCGPLKTRDSSRTSCAPCKSFSTRHAGGIDHNGSWNHPPGNPSSFCWKESSRSGRCEPEKTSTTHQSECRGFTTASLPSTAMRSFVRYSEWWSFLSGNVNRAASDAVKGTSRGFGFGCCSECAQ